MPVDWKKFVKVVGPMIKEIGITPEDEHYDVALEVIRKCSEISDKGGNIFEHFGVKR